MWDQPGDGYFIHPDKKRLEQREILSKKSMDELLKYVRAYETWMNDAEVWSFNAAFRGYRHSAFKENNKEFDENLNFYDAVCREIAKRTLYGK